MLLLIVMKWNNADAKKVSKRIIEINGLLNDKKRNESIMKSGDRRAHR